MCRGWARCARMGGEYSRGRPLLPQGALPSPVALPRSSCVPLHSLPCCTAACTWKKWTAARRRHAPSSRACARRELRGALAWGSALVPGGRRRPPALPTNQPALDKHACCPPSRAPPPSTPTPLLSTRAVHPRDRDAGAAGGAGVQPQAGQHARHPEPGDGAGGDLGGRRHGAHAELCLQRAARCRLRAQVGGRPARLQSYDVPPSSRPLLPQVELVEPPAGALVGERLSVAGFDCSAPDEQLAPKKKIFEQVGWVGLELGGD